MTEKGRPWKVILENKRLSVDLAILFSLLFVFMGWIVWGFGPIVRGKEWGQKWSLAELTKIVEGIEVGTPKEEVLRQIGEEPISKEEGFVSQHRSKSWSPYMERVSQTLVYYRPFACHVYLHFDAEDRFLGYWAGYDG